MKRGDIWTVAGGADYTGKPRPAIIVQSNKFDATRSVVICPLTATDVAAELARFEIVPSRTNGLLIPSYPMVDKISSVPKAKLGYRIGELAANDIGRLNQHLILFLGLAE